MIDQSSQFYAILTNIGVAKQANADVLGIAWKITQMGVGDANGTDPQPNAGQKTLINEWRRAPLNQLKQDSTNPGVIIAEQVIPADVGGKWIREIGLYDSDGDLVAVANCAPSFKPLLTQGSGRTQVVRMNLIVSNTASVELKIDPSVVLATREFVLNELAKQDFKSSVFVCAPGSIVLSGLQTVDGQSVTAGKRVLAPFQTAAKDRGIWIAAAGAWTRATDADTSDEVTPGMLVLVEQGTLYGDSAWQLVTDGPIALGVTALTFEMAWGRTGVTPGEYRSVTVDKLGRVVGASNPSTVAGYGLTDVYTKTQIDSALLAKANLASPTLTGVPKAPTAAASTNTDQIATTAFVQALFTALVGAAPDTLNQINEIAAALGNDANFSTTMMNALALRAPIANPVFTGDPKAPTAAVGDNDTSIANTAFVQAALAAFGIGVTSPVPVILATDADWAKPQGWSGFINVGASKTNGVTVPLTTGGLNPGYGMWTITGRRDAGGGFTGIFTDYANGRTWTGYASTSAAPVTFDEKANIVSPAFGGNPTVPTPAAGDNDTSIANTAFVQDAINRNVRRFLSHVVGVGASVTLTAAQTGSAFNINGANVTITLPAAVDAGAGQSFLIRNGQSKAATIAAPGTALIYTSYDANSSQLVLAPWEWVEIQATTTNYFVNSRGKLGEVALNDSPVFTGDPKAPTPGAADNDTSIATTAFVRLAMALFGVGSDTSTVVTDLNSATQGGFYRAAGGAANSVGTGVVTFVTIPYNSGGCAQLLNQLTAANSPFWYRTQVSGVWSDWHPLANLESPEFTGAPRAPTPAAGNNSTLIATTAFTTSAIKGALGALTGMVGYFAMSTPPDGWLKRNGAAVSRTTYAALFSVIGTTYGAGDGSTTFNLPDSRGYFDRGWDDARGLDPGRVFGSSQADQNASHNHTGTAVSAGAHTHIQTMNREFVDGGVSNANAVYGDQINQGTDAVSSSSSGAHTHTLSISNSGGTEARPINQAFLACIKY
jgi:phage-related tail fiber protein